MEKERWIFSFPSFSKLQPFTPLWSWLNSPKTQLPILLSSSAVFYLDCFPSVRGRPASHSGHAALLPCPLATATEANRYPAHGPETLGLWSNLSRCAVCPGASTLCVLARGIKAAFLAIPWLLDCKSCPVSWLRVEKQGGTVGPCQRGRAENNVWTVKLWRQRIRFVSF